MDMFWKMSEDEFEFLEKDNYSTWKPFMQKLLSCYGQEHWDIVSGKNTRAEAQDKKRFDIFDQNALITIRQAVDKEIHPWVLDQFATSKELWDCIELKFQRKEQKKMKKRAKQKQRKVKQRDLALVNVCDSQNSADFLILPVPNLADDSKTSFGFFGDLLPGIGNGSLLEQSNVLSVFEGHTNLQQEQDHNQCINQLELPHLMIDNDCFLIKEVSNDVTASQDADTDWQFYGCDYEETIQQFAVLFLEDFLDSTDLTSVSHTVITDYATTELVLECIPESSLDFQSMFFHLDLQLEVVESHCFYDNDGITDMFSGEEQNAGNTQEFMPEEEEIVSELPWLEIDSKTCDFQFVLSQVSEHALPLYVNVHIPFACSHDGKVADQHLDVFLGYLSYVDIEGISKQVQVSSRCLHLRNQGLLVFDKPAEGYELLLHYDDSVLQQFVLGLPGQSMEEFSKAYYDYDLMDCFANSLPGQFVVGFSGDITAFQKLHMTEMHTATFQDHMPRVLSWLDLVGQNVESMYVSNTWLESDYGSPTLEQFGKAVTLRKATEWYRGRKTWFKIKIKWQPWLLLWLNLLHMLNFKTYNISGTESKDKGQSWLLLWLSLLYFTSTA